ncbi:hypothetical protein [Vibrio breoganii]|uniref:hypothetical protein n=1 Tax=Vibrio breoganii TaxID=553239 RepID=UPI00030F5589|nr:hypothetical protein [Vibrio breoganii]OED94253.1 hypothetical protein A1QG_05785 [Vibrio breoganii ZF-29]
METTVRLEGVESNKNKSKGVAETNKVSIVDINMPFFSMVKFMIKWAFAAIPAAIRDTIYSLLPKLVKF